ncbi:MAG: preprotein translocase subunit SecE [Candidatus Wildermuthbacteria bacterium]|nr:preprotein translocase subunit SecE [Candidatus Wildermuthbacteria bacterium]
MNATSLPTKLTAFLKEVRTEVKKVNWPTRKETVFNTILVIVFSVAVAAFLGFFDYIFTNIIQRFIIL